MKLECGDDNVATVKDQQVQLDSDGGWESTPNSPEPTGLKKFRKVTPCKILGVGNLQAERKLDEELESAQSIAVVE